MFKESSRMKQIEVFVRDSIYPSKVFLGSVRIEGPVAIFDYDSGSTMIPLDRIAFITSKLIRERE